jgi:hypothetical protein
MAFKLAGGQVGGRGQKLPEGKFEVALAKITAKTSVNKKAKTQGDDYSIVEFVTKRIINQKAVNAKKPDGSTLVIGEVPTEARRSWSMNMKNDASAGNLIAFCAATQGVDPNDGKALAEAATGEDGKVNPDFWDEVYATISGEGTGDNPCEGLRLIVETTLVYTESGWPFMVHAWTPVPAEGEKAA